MRSPGRSPASPDGCGSVLWTGSPLVLLSPPSDTCGRRIIASRQQRSRDLRDLDLVGAAVDLQDLGVAAELLDLELGHVAVAAVELYRLEADVHRRLRGVELARRRLGEAERLAGGGEL